MSSSDIMNTELVDAEPRLFVIDVEPRLSFYEKKKSRSEMRFLPNKHDPSRDSNKTSPRQVETLGN